jgi:hypothetical protein
VKKTIASLLLLLSILASPASATPPKLFSAYLPSAQIFTPPSPLNYTTIHFTGVAIDQTGWFDAASGTWWPQAPGTAWCSWQVWDQAGTTNVRGSGVTAKMIGTYTVGGGNVFLGGKSQDKAAIGDIGSYPNTANSVASAAFRVDVGQYWRIDNYVMADPSAPIQPPAVAGQITVDPNPAHTWWQCMFFAD